MERSDQASELFLSGYNCAQSVVLSFADDLKFSKELGQMMAAGFGGGMGKQQETCGAVTGATWRVRKYGYRPYTAIADVPASGSKDIPVTLIVDPQQT